MNIKDLESRRKKIRDRVLITFFILTRIFFIDFNMVPSSSMTPSFITGDFVLVKKNSLRWARSSVPLLGGYMPNFLKEGWIFSKPIPGKAYAFFMYSDPKVYYLKRCVAVEGQTVQMINGILHIDGVASKMEYIEEFEFLSDSGHLEKGKVFQVTLPNGMKYKVYRNLPFGKGHIDNTKKYKVPKGHVWMQGDFHTGSADSFSVEFMGPVPMENLCAEPFFLLWNSNSRESNDVDMLTWVMQLPQRILIYFKEINIKRSFKSVN